MAADHARKSARCSASTPSNSQITITEVVHEIERLASGEFFERCIDDLGNAVTQVLDTLRGERFADQPAQARVHRRFVREQMVVFEAVEIGLARIGRRPPEFVTR